MRYIKAELVTPAYSYTVRYVTEIFHRRRLSHTGSGEKDSPFKTIKRQKMAQDKQPKKTGWMTTFLRGLAIFFLIMGVYYFAKAWLFN